MDTYVKVVGYLKNNIMLSEQEIEEMLKGDGRVNEIRNYVICMGQSSGSKGVMFVMYSELKKCESAYVNPFIYLGQLADDFENAVINARKKVHGFPIEVWDDETFKVRKSRNANYNSDSLVITFGKYAGKTVPEIFDIDYSYLYWLANNGQFRSPAIIDAMEQYKDIAKEMIITTNREKSNSALPIENNLVVRNVKILSTTVDIEWNTIKYKLIDADGNKFIYNGTAIKNVVGESLDFKCRVANSFESMGVTFNVLKTRRCSK